MEYSKHREFSRVGVQLMVYLHFPDGTTVVGPAADVSLKAVRCVTDARPAVGETCDVTLVFGEGSELPLEMRAEGRVVRHHDDGIVVEHVAIELESHEHLRNLLLVWAGDRDAVDEEFRTHLGLLREPPDED